MIFFFQNQQRNQLGTELEPAKAKPMSTIGNYDKFLQLAAGGHVVVCPSCKDHGVNVLEDGSTRCVLTGETFVATEANSDLFELRAKI